MRVYLRSSVEVMMAERAEVDGVVFALLMYLGDILVSYRTLNVIAKHL